MSTNRSGTERLRAIRGATSVDADDAAAIVDGTAQLLREMLERNRLAAADLVSVFFTATPDLTADFPAVAARRLGIEAPLLGAQEMAVPGSVPRCVRVLMHFYGSIEEVQHVYLGEAQRLRQDLTDNL
jgi:chorismate mutase